MQLSAVNVGDQFKAHLDDLLLYLGDNLGTLLWKAFLILLILFLARVVLNLISRQTKRVIDSKRYHRSEQQGRRVDTMMTLVRSVARYTVYFVAFLLVLGQLGVGDYMGNLLVTAGVGSLAIGIGAQSLVKDVATGFFMMFENQFSVGDYIKLDTVEGTVEATAMRVTYLRTFRGEQIIIPNGTINRVINYSRGNCLALVTVLIRYEDDAQQAMDCIQEAITQFASDHEELVAEPPAVRGITGFTNLGVEIGVMCRAKPMQFWALERGLRLAIKRALDQAGFVIPSLYVSPENSQAGRAEVILPPPQENPPV